ncbi:hypothetical protein [Actinoplanes sp. L3-i22]|uniref:hypothetical protein n=1 Tax=Actinoplanes sp. L3-i22 TaxID=2836373 RepID=UPI001C782630|nr:hypothetical protein [Actinoplanes sp. L3-i22]BCY10995.1 hypothetical protein L3i22_060830 [Actinoplanes sp. L3-i22]
MGEALASYQHADEVQVLTERIRHAHADAHADATQYARAIDAMGLPPRSQAPLLVAAHRRLATGPLAELGHPDQVADDVLTAGFYTARDIDWAATAVQVTEVTGGWYLWLNDGLSGHGMTVPDEDVTLAHRSLPVETRRS